MDTGDECVSNANNLNLCSSWYKLYITSLANSLLLFAPSLPFVACTSGLTSAHFFVFSLHWLIISPVSLQTYQSYSMKVTLSLSTLCLIHSVLNASSADMFVYSFQLIHVFIYQFIRLLLCFLLLVAPKTESDPFFFNLLVQFAFTRPPAEGWSSGQIFKRIYLSTGLSQHLAPGLWEVTAKAELWMYPLSSQTHLVVPSLPSHR